MAAGLEQLVQYLRRLAAPPERISDAVLLERYVRTREEAAFAALVARHGLMVLRVCQRLLADPAGAEDCLQATFLVLARKAGSVRRPDALAGWLHGVALRVAAKARKVKNRRRFAQLSGLASEKPDPHPDPLEQLTAREFLVAVDEEVQRLPEKYRLPVILCCLENLSQEEAARRLGWSPGSVKARLERGRKRLEARLAKRGLTLSAIIGVSAITGGAAVALGPGLRAATVKAALTFAAGMGNKGGAGCATATLLAEAVLQSMVVAKVKVMAVVAVLFAAAIGGGSLALPGHGGKPLETGIQEASKKSAQSVNEESTKPEPLTDLYGDPLPRGALARLGTLRQRAPSSQLAISRDGKEIVTLDQNLTVRRFDAVSGALRKVSQLTSTQKSSLALLSPHGKFALLDSFLQPGYELELWDLAEGKLVLTVSMPKHLLFRDNSRLGFSQLITRVAISGLAFSPDETRVAIADSDRSMDNHRVLVWDLKSSEAKVIWSWEEPLRGYSNVPEVAFSPDGKKLSSVHFDNKLCCWEVEGEKLLWKSHRPISGLIQFSADSRGVITESSIGMFARWDVATGDVTDHKKPMEAFFPVGSSPDGRLMAFEDCFDGMVLWKPGEANIALRLPPAPDFYRPGSFLIGFPRDGLPRNFAFTPDGKAVVRRQGPLQCWDLDTGKPLYAQTENWGHVERVTNVLFSPNGRCLASCADDETVRLWDIASGRALHVLPKSASERTNFRQSRVSFPLLSSDRLLFTPDGKSLLMPAHFKGDVSGLSQWNVATGIREQEFKRPEPMNLKLERWVSRRDTDLRMPPGGNKILLLDRTRHRDDILTIWDTVSGHSISQKPISQRFDCGILTPDGKGILVCDSQDFVLLDIESQKPRVRIQSDLAEDPQRGNVRACELVLSTSGRLMAGRVEFMGGPSGRDRYFDDLRIGDIATGRQLAKIPLSGHAVFSFSADDRLFAVAAGDTIRLLETATWQEVVSLQVQNNLEASHIHAVAFSPDCRTLATGHADSTILLWDAKVGAGDKGGTLNPGQVEALWTDLAASKASKAYAAVWRLAKAKGDTSVLFLKRKLKPVQEEDFAKVRLQIKDLDSESFKVREEARKQLELLDRTIEPALRQALEANPSLEARRRLENLLSRPLAEAPESLRQLRAVQVLERIGSKEAREFLMELANGMTQALLTQEAKAALDRLGR